MTQTYGIAWSFTSCFLFISLGLDVGIKNHQVPIRHLGPSIKFDLRPTTHNPHPHKIHTQVYTEHRGQQRARYFRPPAVEHLLFFAHFGSSKEIRRLNVQLSQLLCSKMRKTFFYCRGLWQFNLTQKSFLHHTPFTCLADIWRSQVLLRRYYVFHVLG